MEGIESSVKREGSKVLEKLLGSKCILAAPLQFCEAKIIKPLDKKANLKGTCAKAAIKIANFILKCFIYLFLVPLAFVGVLGEKCFCYSIENSPCKKVFKKLLERKFISKLYKKQLEIEGKMEDIFKNYESKKAKKSFNEDEMKELFKNHGEDEDLLKKDFKKNGWVYKDRNFMGCDKSLNGNIEDYVKKSEEPKEENEEKKFQKGSEEIKAGSLVKLKDEWKNWIDNSYMGKTEDKKGICFKCIYAAGIKYSESGGGFSVSFDYVEYGKEIIDLIKERSQMGRIRKIFCCCC
jgi:hypothetical protein